MWKWLFGKPKLSIALDEGPRRWRWVAFRWTPTGPGMEHAVGPIRGFRTAAHAQNHATMLFGRAWNLMFIVKPHVPKKKK